MSSLSCQANPAAVKAFLAGLLKADAKVAADKAAAIAAVSAATGGALSVDTIDSQWSNYRFQVGLNKQLLPLLMERLPYRLRHSCASLLVGALSHAPLTAVEYARCSPGGGRHASMRATCARA